MTTVTNEIETPFNLFMADDEAENEYGGGFTTTAQAMYQIGFMVFDLVANKRQEGHESLAKFFPYPAKSTKQVRDEAYKEANDYIVANNVFGKPDKKGNDKLRKPIKGIHLTIKGDDVPTSDDGRFEWGDSTDFTPEFSGDIINFINKSLTGLAPSPIDNYVWCKIERVDSPDGSTYMKLKKDSDGNAMYNADGSEIREQTASTMNIVIDTYPDRAAAVADMDYKPDTSGLNLSATALAGYTADALKGHIDAISADLEAVLTGSTIPTTSETLSAPLSEPAALSKVAGIWAIEPSDIIQLTK